MTFWEYLRDRRAAIVFFCLGLALFDFGLWLDPRHLVHPGTLVYISLLVALFGAVVLVWQYRRTKAWVNQFKARAEAGGDALTWRLPEAHHYEQQAIVAAYNHVLREHQKTQSQLIAQQQDQKAFIDSWVHEIKVPLAATTLLRDSLDGKAPEQPLDEMALQLDKINFYVEQVLYYSRLDSFSKDYLLREYDLTKIVDSVVVDQRNSFIAGQLRFQLQGGPLTVVTDEKWLRFILTQIITNAIKYTKPGGTITATLADTPTEATLTVSDTGIGIPVDEQHRVFEKGFTGTNGRNANQKSTGLGLYLAAQLSQKLGHHLTLTSTVDQGTSVVVHFPHLSYYGESGNTLSKPTVDE